MKKIGYIKGNIYLMSFVAIVIGLVCYFLIFRALHIVYPPWLKGINRFIVVFYVVGILLFHELIHTIAASFFVPIKSVTLRFKLLVWEVHVDKPLKRNQYILYTLAPGFILSLVGMLLFLAFKSVNIQFFSAVLFLIGFAGATGDVWLAVRTLKFPKNCYILDKGVELDILIEDDFV